MSFFFLRGPFLRDFFSQERWKSYRYEVECFLLWSDIWNGLGLEYVITSFTVFGNDSKPLPRNTLRLRASSCAVYDRAFNYLVSFEISCNWIKLYRLVLYNFWFYWLFFLVSLGFIFFTKLELKIIYVCVFRNIGVSTSCVLFCTWDICEVYWY